MKWDCLNTNVSDDENANITVGKSWSPRWLIDSGAAAHLTPHRNDLFE